MADEKLKSFHFDCGNSSKGSIGFCGVIKAETKEEALAIMRRVLPDQAKITPCGDDADNSRVEYIEVYISPGNVKLSDVGYM